MSAKKTPAKKKIPVKENLHKEIISLLIAALGTFKERLGEKKFEKRIKKAAKLLAHDIKPEVAKKKVIKKKPLKKAAKKTIISVASKKSTAKSKK